MSIDLTLEVSVSVEHIDTGQAGSRAACPLALAIRDELKRLSGIAWERVMVSEYGVYALWDSQGLGTRWHHSPESRTFVTLIDSGQKTAAAMLAGRVGKFRLTRDEA